MASCKQQLRPHPCLYCRSVELNTKHLRVCLSCCSCHTDDAPCFVLCCSTATLREYTDHQYNTVTPSFPLICLQPPPQLSNTHTSDSASLEQTEIAAELLPSVAQALASLVSGLQSAACGHEGDAVQWAVQQSMQRGGSSVQVSDCLEVHGKCCSACGHEGDATQWAVHAHYLSLSLTHKHTHTLSQTQTNNTPTDYALPVCGGCP